MRICGISCITNMGAGMEEQELSHSAVNESAGQVSEQFITLIQTLLERLPQ